MNINISISSDSSESRSIHLLTEVVECLQLEKIELNEKFLTLNSKKNNVEIQLAEQVEKCQLLEAEKKELEEKLAEQQGKYQTLEAENKNFESKLTEQEGICQKLETENKEIEEKLLLIESAKKTAVTCSDCGTINYTIKIDQSLIDSESELERSRRVLDKNIAETKDELEEAREEKDEYKNKLNKLEILKREFSKNNKDISSLEERIKDL